MGYGEEVYMKGGKPPTWKRLIIYLCIFVLLPLLAGIILRWLKLW
jgi:hypothetical protein